MNKESIAKVSSLIALTGAVVTLILNIPKLEELFADDRKVNIDYLVIESQSAIPCIINEEGLFHINNNTQVSVTRNACFNEVYQANSKEVKAKDGEILQNVVFAWVKNVGSRLDKVELVLEGDAKTSIGGLDAEKTRVVCLGYSGLAGSQDREFRLKRVALYKEISERPRRLNVRPFPTEGLGGVSECGAVFQGYPVLAQ